VNKFANSESSSVGGVNAPVGSRRELVESVHAADADVDAIQLDSCVASASSVYIGDHEFEWTRCNWKLFYLGHCITCNDVTFFV